MHELTRDQFIADPAAAIESASEQPVVVRGSDGSVRMTLSSPWLDDADCEPIYVDQPVPTRRVIATVRRVNREQRPTNVRMR